MGYQKITKVSKNSQQNISHKTLTNENDKEIPKKKIYISRKKTKNY